MSHAFYFDHNATTPVDPQVLELHAAALGEVFGNASSIHHYGQTARARLEQARAQVARLLGCQTKEIVFVSGGTEANNTAIFSAVRGRGRAHVITTTIEHPAVLNPCAQLEREGITVTYARAGAGGVVDPEEIRRALRPETVLISVMHVNNELGTIQPVEEIARIGREAGVAVHVDGVQAAGRIPVRLEELGVDFYTASAHKMYAPKGTGILYVRSGVRLMPLLYGGRHEQGRRPGTENVPGAIAMGAAAELAGQRMAEEAPRLAALRDRLERGLLARVPEVKIHCAGSPRTPNTSSVCVEGVEGEALVIALDLRGFCVSSGSACSSGAVEPSHVLTAIGLSRAQAKSSIRISLGRSNDEAQVDALIEAVAECAARLRRLSTDWVAHV